MNGIGIRLANKSNTALFSLIPIPFKGIKLINKSNTAFLLFLFFVFCSMLQKGMPKIVRNTPQLLEVKKIILLFLLFNFQFQIETAIIFFKCIGERGKKRNSESETAMKCFIFLKQHKNYSICDNSSYIRKRKRINIHNVFRRIGYFHCWQQVLKFKTISKNAGAVWKVCKYIFGCLFFNPFRTPIPKWLIAVI